MVRSLPPVVPIWRATLATLLELSEAAAGARFRLADLQLHTPVDRNFRPGTYLDRDDQKDAFAKDYVSRCVTQGLGVVAITEHNDVSWIDRLRTAASGLDVLIFPGFEIASSEGVHVLCLWEPSETSARLEELLVEAGLPSHARWHSDGTPRMSPLSLRDLVRFVHDRGGLSILSHVDREDGVLHRLTGEPRIRAWQESGALAVQCSKSPLAMDPGSFYRRALLNEGDQYRRERPYACIQTSDARSLDEIGSKPTYVKMSSESIEGLRQAFLDADSRVRFPDEHEVRAYPRILAVQWDGCFLQAEVPLNTNLNCLIGGKGSAKSTVVETIRHAFGISIESQAVREQAASLIAETFPSSAKISLLVEVAEPQAARYIIERTGSERPVVRSAETGEILDGLQPVSLVRPIIFGQKEIYETALKLESQLILLDRYCASELEPLLAQESKLVGEIGDQSQQIRSGDKDLLGLDNQLSELPALKEKKRLFDEAGLAEKLAEQRDLERERGVLEGAESVLRDHRDLLAQLRQDVDGIPGMAQVENTPNADLVEAVRLAVDGLDGVWQGAAETVEKAIVVAEEEVKGIKSTWSERFEARRAEFDKAVQEVAGEHGEANIRDYVKMDAKIDRLNELAAQRQRRRRQIRESRQKRQELVAELREVRRQIFLVRQRTAADLTDALDDAVHVEVVHQGNRDAVVRAIRNLRSGAGTRAIDELVGRADFASSRIAELLRGDAADLASEYGVSDGVAQQLIRSADAEHVDALEVMALDDLVEISLNVGEPGRPDFRKLDRLSAGQRSTAILLLALLESDGPLILDQPEDDLDNRFIYDDVVRRLRGAKEQRQFIIATHNANIPVLGDAEQIVVLDTEVTAKGVVRAMVAVRGSIDDAPLHGPLEDVLEGGREAFERRKEKYGF